MKEPRLEPRPDDLGCCPHCGRDDISLNYAFCRDCNKYMTKDETTWVENFEDWLDHIYEDKLKAQGCL
jgi:hypothetical protein